MRYSINGIRRRLPHYLPMALMTASSRDRQTPRNAFYSAVNEYEMHLRRGTIQVAILLLPPAAVNLCSSD